MSVLYVLAAAGCGAVTFYEVTARSYLLAGLYALQVAAWAIAAAFHADTMRIKGRIEVLDERRR